VRDDLTKRQNQFDQEIEKMNTLTTGLKHLLSLIVAALLALAMPQITARAEVTDSAPGGFTVKLTVTIHTAPEEVYRKLVHNVGDWWDSSHTFSQDAHNLSIDERPMGCFCERLKDGGAARHMEVIYFQPGKTLRMSGGLGPLQSLPVSGVATFSLSPTSDGTKLDLVYAIGGYSPQGLAPIAPVVDQVLAEQLNRLKSYVETGKAASPEKR
jgi:uncharacterized protein YndB with AHSA1/START domain